MKKNLRLLSIVIGLLLVQWSAYAQTSIFTYTGTIQTYTVPAGYTSISVDVKGAAGGASYTSNGGCGGRVVCTLAVTPGEVLNLFVGSMGGGATLYSGGAGGNTGPTVSGGVGGTSLSFFGGGGGGGGGASDIRIGGTALANRKVAAGGGGGGGDDCGAGSETGGPGGGPATAGNGLDCGSYSAFSCGAGATPIAGGAGSTGGGFTGGPLVGGRGIATSTYYYYYYTFTDGGGGGGGYFGGGGASAGGGGGGSSYADPTIATSIVHTQGSNCTDGTISITPLCSPPVGGAIVGSTTLCVGSTIIYTDPTGTPGGTWTSSNPAAATVNPVTGALTGVAPGTTTLTYTITLSCGTASASTVITVVTSTAPITGRLSVCLGDADTLFDATGAGTWGSLTPGVATIDPVTGIISTVSPGTTTITYTAGACSASAVLTVNALPPAISGPSSVCRFMTITLTDPTPGGTWSSTVPGAITVSPAGVVTSVGPLGATNILYTLNGCSTSHFVNVSLPPVAITGPHEVCQGNAIVLNEPIGGGSWSSSSTPVATVTMALPTSNGVVTGVGIGVVTIAYTMPSCPPATYVVSVNPIPSAIYGPSAVCVGVPTVLMDTTVGGSWSSLNPAITVSPTGVVTTATPGTSGTIVYMMPTGCSVSTVVNTGTSPSAISGIDTICQGATSTLSATPPAGSPPGVWSSTNLAIAPVIDTTGVVTGVSAGTVNISYTLPSGCFAVTPFVVNPPVTPRVVISNYPSGSLCEGTSDTFVATPINGGIATYQWTKFSVIIPGATSDTFVYAPIHGDVINCVMLAGGVCAVNDTATDTTVLNVYPHNVVPIVTISTGSSDTIGYIGQTVTFFSTVTWGGDNPTYQWYMNRAIAPGMSTASSYTTTIYESDTFYCVVMGNPPCEDSGTPPATSNTIIIHDYLSVDHVSMNGNQFSLFPNPNNGTFTLTGTLATASNDEVTYDVSDMLGQVVFRGKTTPQNGKIKQQIDLGSIATGSYLLRVNTDQGGETFHFVIGK